MVHPLFGVWRVLMGVWGWLGVFTAASYSLAPMTLSCVQENRYTAVFIVDAALSCMPMPTDVCVKVWGPGKDALDRARRSIKAQKALRRLCEERGLPLCVQPLYAVWQSQPWGWIHVATPLVDCEQHLLAPRIKRRPAYLTSEMCFIVDAANTMYGFAEVRWVCAVRVVARVAPTWQHAAAEIDNRACRLVSVYGVLVSLLPGCRDAARPQICPRRLGTAKHWPAVC